jgi:hypothetical protein
LKIARPIGGSQVEVVVRSLVGVPEVSPDAVLPRQETVDIVEHEASIPVCDRRAETAGIAALRRIPVLRAVHLGAPVRRMASSASRPRAGRSSARPDPARTAGASCVGGKFACCNADPRCIDAGVYRIRGGNAQIIYIGEGMIAARLAAHQQSAHTARSPQGQALDAAQPLTCSWVVNARWADHQ